MVVSLRFLVVILLVLLHTFTKIRNVSFLRTASTKPLLLPTSRSAQS